MAEGNDFDVMNDPEYVVARLDPFILNETDWASEPTDRGYKIQESFNYEIQRTLKRSMTFMQEVFPQLDNEEQKVRVKTIYIELKEKQAALLRERRRNVINNLSINGQVLSNRATRLLLAAEFPPNNALLFGTAIDNVLNELSQDHNRVEQLAKHLVPSSREREGYFDNREYGQGGSGRGGSRRGGSRRGSGGRGDKRRGGNGRGGNGGGGNGQAGWEPY